MKQIIIKFLTGIFILWCLVGCTNNKDNSENSKYKIGIVQIADHMSLNEIREAFVNELKTFDVDVDIKYKDAQNNMSNLSSICQEFVGDKKDLIVAISTPAAQAALNAVRDSNIPVLFSAVTDPVGAGLISPDKNATGTSDFININEIFALAKKLTPNAKTFGLLYNLGESNSASVVSNVKKYANDGGLSIVDKPVTNISEIQKAIESMEGNVDAIFLPIDNTVATAMATISKLTRELKIPVYTAADSLVKGGGFATVGINYTELGKETAKMAKKIINGENVSKIPVVILKGLDTVINMTTADRIAVKIPPDILNSAKIFK